jgi:hypothetical protein
MKDLRFHQLVFDASLFIKYNNSKRIVVVVYVNNALFCGPNKAKVLKAKQDFMSKWECQDLGDTTDFFCMQITQKGDKLSFNQVDYLDKILNRFGMVNSKLSWLHPIFRFSLSFSHRHLLPQRHTHGCHMEAMLKPRDRLAAPTAPVLQARSLGIWLPALYRRLLPHNPFPIKVI